MSIIKKVDSPIDIRWLNISELEQLCQEIRDLIIDTVSKNGGHLASSLGSVELTIALHRVFNTPHDKIVWDVGHQAYAHKIITGRRDKFHTLRQKDGISGFPKRDESPYDVFDVGHSSTSISAAIGLAEADALASRKGQKIVAVIGDGSMNSGMALEALNWSGDRKTDVIIVLNDNEMSISPNVGAMSSYLNRIMTGNHAMRLRDEVKRFFASIPHVGKYMLSISRNLEESLKSMITPGSLFEDLGYTYVGPFDGHRLDNLIKNFENIKSMSGPILVHVITKKGKGYKYAEEMPDKFHGVGPFCVETGEVTKSSSVISYSKSFGDAMMKFADDDACIVAITAAMTDGTGLKNFARKFPQRFFDVGIAEQHAVTFAGGLALGGYKPVVAIYSSFLQRSYDQILHDICMQKLPVTFAIDRGGFVGDDGPTHHGVFDFSFLRSTPNMIVMAPKDENELQHMLYTALYAGQPAAVRYPRGAGEGIAIESKPQALEIGKAELVHDGKDIAIFAIGSTVYPALRVAEQMAKEGVSVCVINSRFVKPLDAELLLATAADLKKVITVEENVLLGGFGSAVSELFAKAGFNDVSLRQLGLKDEFYPQATQAELKSMSGIDEDAMIKEIKAVLDKR